MRKKYVFALPETERDELKQVIAAGRGPARRLARARILLKADRGSNGPGLPDDAIVEAVEVSLATVGRVRKQYVEEGLERALNRRRPRVPKEHKLDGRQEAQLVALACSQPPAGRARWSLRLLADRMVELEYVDCVSYATVRRVLKKTNLSPG